MPSTRREFLTGMMAWAGASALGAYALKSIAEEAAKPVLLSPFPLRKQETPYTCGPASLRMVLEFFGHQVPEAELAKTMGTTSLTGTSAWGMHYACEKYLKQFQTGLKPEDKIGKSAANEIIFQSLEKRLPAIFTWLVENYFKPKTLVGHYSVLIGFDQSKKEFTIANPFGSIHPIDFDRFWRLANWSPCPEDFPELSPKLPGIKLPASLVILQRA